MKIVFAMLALCGLMAAADNAAEAAGAIAIGKCTRVGYSFDYPSQGAAERRALSECRANGDRSCQVVVTIHRSCGAFAVSGGCGARGWGYAPTRGRAETVALNSCRKYGGNDCRVRAWVCDSGP
ncbi:MAG TPA: DUF4189 domain-containing protein [Pseudolabrys sp.]|nr:DUF4189 domain-containing protein [Pseudolabrys sp.]